MKKYKSLFARKGIIRISLSVIFGFWLVYSIMQADGRAPNLQCDLCFDENGNEICCPVAPPPDDPPSGGQQPDCPAGFIFDASEGGCVETIEHAQTQAAIQADVDATATANANATANAIATADANATASAVANFTDTPTATATPMATATPTSTATSIPAVDMTATANFRNPENKDGYDRVATEVVRLATAEAQVAAENRQPPLLQFAILATVIVAMAIFPILIVAAAAYAVLNWARKKLRQTGRLIYDLAIGVPLVVAKKYIIRPVVESVNWVWDGTMDFFRIGNAETRARRKARIKAAREEREARTKARQEKRAARKERRQARRARRRDR